MFWFTLVKSYKMGFLICQIARRKPNYVRKQAFENPSTVDIKTLVISTILFYISRKLVSFCACVFCCVCVVLLVCRVAYVLC